MPTGYTATLMEKGQTFPEYALTCARAFGHLIHMRDDSMKAKIRFRDKESYNSHKYHQKAYDRETSTYEKLSAMAEAARERHGVKLKADAVKSAERVLKEKSAEGSRLNDMKLQVEAWTPPSAEHDSLKEFMLQQISVSRDSTEYYTKELSRAVEKDPSEYFDDALGSSRSMAKYHADRLEEATNEDTSGDDWIIQLFESLGVQPPEKP